MLKLVVDNSKGIQEHAKTCRNSCELFDPITERCSIKENINVDSPYEASRCGHFLDNESMDIDMSSQKNQTFTLIGEEEDYILDDEELFHELTGTQFNFEESTYPDYPDFPSRRKDATWYVSPDASFGCWVINLSKRPLPVLKSRDEAEKGWSKNVYKSAIPLHNHKSSLPLASRIAWVVDEEGYGQYCLLINGKISTISAPKPFNWKK